MVWIERTVTFGKGPKVYSCPETIFWNFEVESFYENMYIYVIPAKKKNLGQ